jgi:TP901 family phage tail tape measure protein
MAENKVRVVFEAFMDKFKRDVKDAAKATLEIGDAGSDASKKVNFDKANDSVNLLEKNLNRVAGTIKAMAVGYIGKKLFDGTKENLDYIMDFQDGMKAVHTLLPELSEAGLGEASKQVKEFAKEMKVLPEYITPALYDSISAGVPDVEVFDFLKDAQIAAVGGRTDLATSVDFLTNVINAYGREVITATEASDAMFIGMRNGKVSFDEMAAHMYSIVPVASGLELPFDNIAAAVGRMGAQSTPVAQATTQLGAFLRELSSVETKGGDIFHQATKKTLRQFIAEGNNIQDIIMVMDAAAKQLNVEAIELFSSKEAGNVVLSLTKGKEEFTQDLIAMQNAGGDTGEAFKKMDSTLKATFDGIKSRIAVFKLDIAEKYFPQVQDATTKLEESFIKLDENGTLNNLATSIGGLVSSVITQFDNIIDGIIEKIDSLASFIDTSLPGAIEVVKALAWAFLAVKTGMLIKDGISLFQGGIKILTPIIAGLTKGLWGATTAQTTLNTTMALNPIGAIIIAISLLIMAILNLSGEYMSFNDFLLVSFELIKIAFYSLLWVLVKGFDIIIWGLDKLIGWIPGIGEALEKVADVSGKALDRLSSSIDDSIRKIDELNNKEIKDKIPKPGTPGGGMTPEQEDLALAQYAAKAEKGTTKNTIESEKQEKDIYKVSSKKEKKKKEKTKTIHDRIREVQDKTNPDIDLYESRSDLAKVKEDDKGVKQNKNLIVETLRKQAGDMLNLQLSSKGQDVKIVEAARNKLLVKIEETLKDINDGVSKMVGDFNTPSDLRVLTEYQYKVDKSDNNLSKRYVYSPKVNMYLTIPDTGEKGIAQTKAEVEHFTGAIFDDDKNDLVTKFMQDVTRN